MSHEISRKPNISKEECRKLFKKMLEESGFKCSEELLEEFIKFNYIHGEVVREVPQDEEHEQEDDSVEAIESLCRFFFSSGRDELIDGFRAELEEWMNRYEVTIYSKKFDNVTFGKTNEQNQSESKPQSDAELKQRPTDNREAREYLIELIGRFCYDTQTVLSKSIASKLFNENEITQNNGKPFPLKGRRPPVYNRFRDIWGKFYHQGNTLIAYSVAKALCADYRRYPWIFGPVYEILHWGDERKRSEVPENEIPILIIDQLRALNKQRPENEQKNDREIFTEEMKKWLQATEATLPYESWIDEVWEFNKNVNKEFKVNLEAIKNQQVVQTPRKLEKDDFVASLATLLINKFNARMYYMNLISLLNANDYKNSWGGPYKEDPSRGAARVVGAVWNRLNKKGLDHEKNCVASTFTNSVGYHDWQNYQ